MLAVTLEPHAVINGQGILSTISVRSQLCDAAVMWRKQSALRYLIGAYLDSRTYGRWLTASKLGVVLTMQKLPFQKSVPGSR